jgi:hypothetical protein
MSHRSRTLLSTAAAASLMASVAFAEDAPVAAAPSAPATVNSWVSSIKFSGHIEVGATMNPQAPADNINFGHLFTDKANQIVLNQVAITAERDLDPKATGLDFGFKLQGMYGLDSQFTHFLGEGDHSSHSRNQFDVVEANLLMHIPIPSTGGMDVKVGQFSTPLGNEVIDPTGNFFYSHSYIFNFGIPLKHTGFLTTTHLNPMVDIYAGYTTGVNTSLGSKGGYNDGQFHFLGGIGLNLKNLTILALTHIGPENPAGSLPDGVNIHKQYRYLSDIVATWKVNGKLTSVTELNYIRDDGFNATGGGIDEYLTYPLSPIVTAGIRAELWRDNNAFFVFAFPGNQDYVNSELGLSNNSYGIVTPVTYGAVTIGLNIKPSHLPKLIDGLNFRPEIRYDRSLAGAAPFGNAFGVGGKKDQITIGLDMVMPLSF